MTAFYQGNERFPTRVAWATFRGMPAIPADLADLQQRLAALRGSL